MKKRGIKLDSIQTWQDYYFQNQLAPSRAPMFSVDEEINGKISLWKGDICQLEIDAIVNAANKQLGGGTGVNGAIQKAAGRELLAKCRELYPSGTDTGTAKITSGFLLPAEYIIHAVGPRGVQPALLRSAYESSLRFVGTHRIRSIAFPSISTGVYGYPPQEAAPIAAEVVRRFLQRHKNDIDRIIFVVYDQADKFNYENVLPRYFPVGPLSHGYSASSRPTSSRIRPKITLDDLSRGIEFAYSSSTLATSSSIGSLISEIRFESIPTRPIMPSPSSSSSFVGSAMRRMSSAKRRPSTLPLPPPKRFAAASIPLRTSPARSLGSMTSSDRIYAGRRHTWAGRQISSVRLGSRYGRLSSTAGPSASPRK